MEDAKRRWCVTYTKHMKQKRKVYQDGFIDLHISTNKVKLYDDCEKLLECRILKKDEIISCGETLTFNAYFVDVGDPEEFKKRELEKYGTPQSSPDTKDTKTTEWQVLYTTQLTQKAKKYHDGFVRLKICGSQGRQILLFDETRKLLDSRFLRRDEVIKSSESVAFDGHLVEIGELEENPEPLADLNVHRNNSNIAGKAEALHRQQNYIKNINSDGKEFRKSEVSQYGAPQSGPDTINSSTYEWQVMYTTQVTQKAKKYHDGSLRLAIIGSFRRQVMLYDDGRKLLNSRFLKKDEVIRSGESISFDAHLVDIGEPQEHRLQMDVNLEGFNSNVVQKTEIMHKQQNSLRAYKSVVKGKSQTGACSSKNADSTFNISSEAKKSIPMDNPLRDASQILSILQRPMTVNSIDAGCTDKELEVSDVVDHKSCKNLTVGRPNEDTETGNCPDLMSSVAKFTSNGSQISKDNQSQLDVKAGDKSNEEVDERKNSEKLNTSSKLKEFPSFDLGF
ncbi:hypothetical protein LWI28_020301 [Acer negundo]|uniref:5'-3' DNA helicase ZGRF1-like N-terminal domain-containing protein n=1 Tax=Acer negundo TaxID=4023 RepID=A0AAD5IRX1_ACENE|nr:hypothetical protein LWI28_020301 [Acer negundo]KAK4843642.1 hypothetical protein QYF36_010991 [Acer negundo]